MAKKLTYEYVKEYIESFGYKLLSKEYVGANEKLELQCPEGHEFLMIWSNFKREHRCPKCVGVAKLTYKEVKEYIESFEGYKLISKEYLNNHTKLKIQCPKGHTYKSTYNNFKTGNRCPVCFGNVKLTYKQVKEYIESFGYKLISTKYINATTKMELQCNKKHTYKTTYNNFKQGYRCPVCANKKRKLTYKYVKEYIESFGYKLISKEYINNNTKLEIQCTEGHKFSMRWLSFHQGNRCPQCYALKQSSKGEKEVCEYVKSLTREPILENDRTQIVNPLTGYNLELDIYIPSLNKAIEFNSEHWHSGPESVAKDKEKVRQCKEKNIDLLVVDWEKWESCKLWCMEIIKNFIEENNE